ncbi:dienelactone hydrolase family protein [Seongchinamella unica]|uniref:Dienelactone hydrolase family protein n=1 Tax=Seongchinamella unica TaxID=2547392 RepID=A0A4R5LNA7_9GAMM|nr:dienelactone hydrolase family protein [Seongchinamella unica]TDG11827.1 dienelactone hydrolase family protein [Seongchinamella unica]
MTIQTRLIEYTHGDVLLEGMLAWEDSLHEPRPGVVIAHAWGGRSAFEEGKAQALAEQGYVGFALDMYGKGVLGADPEENSALMAPFMENRALLQQRIALAVSVLREQPEVDPNAIAAMGFCFGGLCVLDLARSGSDVQGVVSFHGLFTPPGNTAGNRINAKVLCLHGYDDPMAEPAAMTALASELTAAGADWQIHAYGNTQHAFTNPAANNADMGTVYSASADRRSARALANFLEEIFA